MPIGHAGSPVLVSSVVALESSVVGSPTVSSASSLPVAVAPNREDARGDGRRAGIRQLGENLMNVVQFAGGLALVQPHAEAVARGQEDSQAAGERAGCGLEFRQVGGTRRRPNDHP